MKAMKCAFHNSETIVNFCRNDECLLPMCPTCVKLHSKEHMSQNTHGLYENIVDVYQEIEKSLKELLQSLINCGDDLKEASQRKQNRKSLLTKRMSEMKTKTIDSITKYIQSMEKEILEGLQNIQSTINEDFSHIDQRIQATSAQIRSQLDNLLGDKPLKTIIGHLAQDKGSSYEQQIFKINKKIGEVNSVDIGVNKDFKISQLSEVLRNLKNCYISVFGQTLSKKPLRNTLLRDQNILKESIVSKKSSKATSEV